MGAALLALLVALDLAVGSGGDLAVGGGLGAGVSVAFGGGGLVGSAGVVCAGAVALAVGSMKAALDAPGGRMNLLYAGAWAAAMALARSSGLLVLELEVDLVAWNSHTSVGCGSSFLLLAGVGSGGDNIQCHLSSSGDTSSKLSW